MATERFTLETARAELGVRMDRMRGYRDLLQTAMREQSPEEIDQTWVTSFHPMISEDMGFYRQLQAKVLINEVDENTKTDDREAMAKFDELSREAQRASAVLLSTRSCYKTCATMRRPMSQVQEFHDADPTMSATNHIVALKDLSITLDKQIENSQMDESIQ